jgi:mono/diheme cytochrome c family protein
MPPFALLGAEGIEDLTTYVQSLGGRDADARMRRQEEWNERARRAFEAGPDENIAWLHENIPAGWITVPNPYESNEASIARGEHIYQEFCIGCHGPVGDGQGPAGIARGPDGQLLVYPPPLNFTTLRRTGGASGGVLYYQIMNGITGTAMPYFAHELESEKIWDVSNYLMLFFMSGREFGVDGQAINAAHEAPQEDER